MISGGTFARHCGGRVRKDQYPCPSGRPSDRPGGGSTADSRAASEMTKRVERIARKVMGDNAVIMTDAPTWAGTYHGIGARLLREPRIHEDAPPGLPNGSIPGGLYFVVTLKAFQNQVGITIHRTIGYRNSEAALGNTMRRHDNIIIMRSLCNSPI
jgi:superfamily I DNA/RNA helicase